MVGSRVGLFGCIFCVRSYCRFLFRVFRFWIVFFRVGEDVYLLFWKVVGFWEYVCIYTGLGVGNRV